MKKITLTFAIILTLIVPQTILAEFSDVTESTNYANAIDWMQENTVIQGYPDGSFKPDQCVNRAEFLKMLFLTHQNVYTHMIGDFPYSDVPLDEWYTEYVNYYTGQGVIQGYPDGSFKPGQCVNRVEAIKMAVLDFNNSQVPTVDGYAGISIKLGSVKDVDYSEWYGPYFTFVYISNLIGLEHMEEIANPNSEAGVDRYYFPADLMNRAEVAELLYRTRALEDSEEIMYNDTFIPDPLEITIECIENPVLTEIGRYVYPVKPEYEHLNFLGELFTADECTIFDENLVYKIFGVENSDYTIGSFLHLNETEAELTDVTTVLEKIGYHCMDSDGYCGSWELSVTVPVAEILRLKPYANIISDNDCINCG